MAKLGWCLDGHCLPGPRTQGCPGELTVTTLACDCTCHGGQPPDLATRTLAADKARWPAEPGDRSKEVLSV